MPATMKTTRPPTHANNKHSHEMRASANNRKKSLFKRLQQEKLRIADLISLSDRDRQRSTWIPHVQTCRALATSTPISADPPPGIAFAAAAEAFAVEYHLMFGHVPSGYLNALGQPLDADSRAYQNTRGPGDGRSVDSVLPITLSSGLVRIRPNGAIVSYEQPHLDDFSSEDETDAQYPQQGEQEQKPAGKTRKRVRIIAPSPNDEAAPPPFTGLAGAASAAGQPWQATPSPPRPAQRALPDTGALPVDKAASAAR